MKRQHSPNSSASNPSQAKQACDQHSTKAFSSSDQPVNLSGCSATAIGDHATFCVHYHGHSEQSTGSTIEPRKLQEELRHKARICSQQVQPLPIQLKRPIVPVCLQIAKEPVRVLDVLHADGYLHQRKNIVKFYEQPPGDISEEKMFDLPKQQAQREAAWNYFEYEADKTEYIKNHGNILAVIGWPGIGKTTSMMKWINQIRKGELVPGVTYVFFIFVRHINFSKKMTVFQFLLSTIIPEWEHSTESDKAWLKELFSDPNVLIALEGLDESAVKDLKIKAPLVNIYDTADPLDIMLNLIGGKLLPLARIVISSRPDQLFHLHLEHRPKCIVQILGLNKDARDELGHQIWGDSYKLAKVILDDNPDTFAYCFVPVNFLLTVDYLIHEGKVDSVCMTKVLASACKRYAVSDHLKGKECKLNELFKLAWNGYKKMQIVFEETDFEKANIDRNTVDSFLHQSIVQSADIKMTIMDGDKRSSFSHLIWQEFMVAVHLLHYSIEDFDELLQHIHKDRWEVIAKFLFGLCNRDVFVKIRNFKGSCSEDQWLKRRDKLKKIAITRMKGLNQQLPARQDVESPQNQNQSVTASRCQSSNENEPPVVSPCLQSTSYSCQQPTTNQNLQPVPNQYKPIAPNQYQNAIANQVHLFDPSCQSVTSPYEQQAANQHVPVWARSHQQVVPQLNQSLMTSQSQQLSSNLMSHQLPSNKFVSSQHWPHPAYPGPWGMANHLHRSESSQHLLPEANQSSRPCDQQQTNIYPSLIRSSHQQLRLNHDEQLTANSYSQLLADQHQLFSERQSQHFATNTNQQVPANFHPTSTHYQQVAANSYLGFASNQHHAVKPHHPNSSQAPSAATHQFQESSSTEFQPNPLRHVPLTQYLQQLAANSDLKFASNQHHAVKPHHPNSSQAPLAATHQFQQSSSTEFQPNPFQHVPLTHYPQQLAAKSLHDDDDLQQRATESYEDYLNLSEEDPSDDDSEWKTLLQVCSWIHEANDENITRDVVAHLPDHIEFPEITTILPSDVSNVFYALRSSSGSHTLEVDDCNFTGDSLKLFSKEVSSSNIKIQHFGLLGKKLNDEDFSSVVEISQHVEEKLVLVDCGITSCQVSSLAEKLRETGHKLKVLSLSYNELIGDGARSLIPCLHLIKNLWLVGCNVTAAVEEEIRSELKRLDLPESRVDF